MTTESSKLSLSRNDVLALVVHRANVVINLTNSYYTGTIGSSDIANATHQLNDIVATLVRLEADERATKAA